MILLFVGLELRGAPEPRTALVFPFENQGTRLDLGWISEGFAEILSSRLAAPNRTVLDREERNAAYEQLGLPPGTPVTLASVYKVAETLGADWAVVGSFNVEGNRLTARAQLLDVRGLKLPPALEATGELAELVDLTTQLAWRLLATHDPGFTAGKEEDFRRHFPEIRLDSFENYVRGILAADGDSRVRFLTEADRLDPADHRAAFELGRYFFEQKDYANSARWFWKLDAKDSHYHESLFLLGVDEFFLGRDSVAERAFTALAKQMPLNEVSNNLGVLEVRGGRYAEALADFERAYRGDPTDADFNFNLAVCLWYLKQYDAVVPHLEEVLRVTDEDSEAHTLLAVVLGRLGNSAGQQREILWLAEHEGSPEPPADLAGDFFPQTRLKKKYDGRAFRLLSLAVRNVLEERLADEPPARHGEVHLSRGKQFFAESRWPEAEHELTEAVSLLPRDSEAHLALAQVLEAQGRHRQAAAELETSLKLKDSVGAHLWLARVYLSLEQPEAARDHGRAALSLDPGNRDAERLIDQIRQRIPTTRRTP